MVSKLYGWRLCNGKCRIVIWSGRFMVGNFYVLFERTSEPASAGSIECNRDDKFDSPFRRLAISRAWLLHQKIISMWKRAKTISTAWIVNNIVRNNNQPKPSWTVHTNISINEKPLGITANQHQIHTQTLRHRHLGWSLIQHCCCHRFSVGICCCCCCSMLWLAIWFCRQIVRISSAFKGQPIGKMVALICATIDGYENETHFYFFVYLQVKLNAFTAIKLNLWMANCEAIAAF